MNINIILIQQIYIDMIYIYIYIYIYLHINMHLNHACNW